MSNEQSKSDQRAELSRRKDQALSSNLQAQFETLLSRFIVSNNEETEPAITIQDDTLGTMQEQLFASRNIEGTPQIGVRIELQNGSAEYLMRISQVNPPEIGLIYEADASLTLKKNQRGITMPDEGLGRRLLTPMAQAFSNVMNIPILHTQKVDVFDKDKIQWLKENGYTLRKGFKDYYQRIFTPQSQKLIN